MKRSIHFVGSFIYETDNIPNRESRIYGLSKRLLALRGLVYTFVSSVKKPY